MECALCSRFGATLFFSGQKICIFWAVSVPGGGSAKTVTQHYEQILISSTLNNIGPTMHLDERTNVLMAFFGVGQEGNDNPQVNASLFNGQHRRKNTILSLIQAKTKTNKITAKRNASNEHQPIHMARFPYKFSHP